MMQFTRLQVDRCMSAPERPVEPMLLMCERAVHTRVEMVVTVMAALLCAVLPTVAGASTHAGTKPNV